MPGSSSHINRCRMGARAFAHGKLAPAQDMGCRRNRNGLLLVQGVHQGAAGSIKDPAGNGRQDESSSHHTFKRIHRIDNQRIEGVQAYI